MDLIDEKHRPRLERRQKRCDVALPLQRWACGLDELDAELGGDDLRQRGLPETGWPCQQNVVKGLAAARRRRDRDRHLILDRALADEVDEAAGPERAIELFVRNGRRILDAGLRLGQCLAVLRAAVSRSSARSPVTPARSSSASTGL